jgi:hypothetical protein
MNGKSNVKCNGTVREVRQIATSHHFSELVAILAQGKANIGKKKFPFESISDIPPSVIIQGVTFFLCGATFYNDSHFRTLVVDTTAKGNENLIYDGISMGKSGNQLAKVKYLDKFVDVAGHMGDYGINMIMYCRTPHSEIPFTDVEDNLSSLPQPIFSLETLIEKSWLYNAKSREDAINFWDDIRNKERKHSPHYNPPKEY